MNDLYTDPWNSAKTKEHVLKSGDGGGKGGKYFENLRQRKNARIKTYPVTMAKSFINLGRHTESPSLFHNVRDVNCLVNVYCFRKRDGEYQLFLDKLHLFMTL